jgi:hypothetical protein
VDNSSFSGCTERSCCASLIHATCAARGNPTSFYLTPGQAHDLEGADALLPDIVADMQAFLADKAYDAPERVLSVLETAGARP